MHATRKATRAGLGVLSLWTTDKGTFPVLLCAGIAAVACTFTAARAISHSPDVRINKDRRRNALSFTEEDGNEWRARRLRIAQLESNPINQSRQFDSIRDKDEGEEAQ